MSKFAMYSQYYAQQSGGGLSTFKGLPRMTGHGFGSIFGNIFRFVQPYLLPFLKSARDEAVKGGIRVLTDIADKKPVAESLKNNIKLAGRNLINDSLQKMSGRGIKRLGANKKNQSRRRSPRSDIFCIKKQ